MVNYEPKSFEPETSIINISLHSINQKYDTIESQDVLANLKEINLNTDALDSYIDIMKNRIQNLKEKVIEMVDQNNNKK